MAPFIYYASLVLIWLIALVWVDMLIVIVVWPSNATMHIWELLTLGILLSGALIMLAGCGIHVC